MGIKNILRKAAELVVELPPEAPQGDADFVVTPVTPAPVAAKTVEQIVRESPGPNLDEIQVPDQPEVQLISPQGIVDFSAVYAKAGLPAASFSAEQALEVMNSLPAELPLDVKRKTVQATLEAMGKAMGVNTESVIADTSRKLAALSAYEDLLNHQAARANELLESSIAGLKKQIEEQEAKIAHTKSLLANAEQQIQTESDRLDDVLEFFTLDVHPSANAPK